MSTKIESEIQTALDTPQAKALQLDLCNAVRKYLSSAPGGREVKMMVAVDALAATCAAVIVPTRSEDVSQFFTEQFNGYGKAVADKINEHSN